MTCSSENFLLGATMETCAGLSVMSPGGRTYFSSLGVKAPRERTSNLCVPCLRALFLPCAVSVLNWQRPGVLLSCFVLVISTVVVFVYSVLFMGHRHGVRVRESA